MKTKKANSSRHPARAVVVDTLWLGCRGREGATLHSSQAAIPPAAAIRRCLDPARR